MAFVLFAVAGLAGNPHRGCRVFLYSHMFHSIPLRGLDNLHGCTSVCRRVGISEVSVLLWKDGSLVMYFVFYLPVADALCRLSKYQFFLFLARVYSIGRLHRYDPGRQSFLFISHHRSYSRLRRPKGRICYMGEWFRGITSHSHLRTLRRSWVQFPVCPLF